MPGRNTEDMLAEIAVEMPEQTPKRTNFAVRLLEKKTQKSIVVNSAKFREGHYRQFSKFPCLSPFLDHDQIRINWNFFSKCSRCLSGR